MARIVVPVALFLLAFVTPGLGGPVDGSSWAKYQIPGGTGSEPGTHKLTRIFVAGQRACVIVIGDHKPVVDVEVKIYDSKKQLVAERRGTRPAQDFVAVMWYPPRQESYDIVINSYGTIENICSIAIK